MTRSKPFLWLVIVVLVWREASAQCTPGINRNPTSNCVVFDSMHLKTFDGSVLSYNSKCGYTLTSFNSNGINFEVDLLPNVATLQAKYGDHIFEIKFSDTATELNRDGKQQSIPHASFGVSISKPGSMIIVEIKDIGIKIRYDGKTTEIIQNNEGNNHIMMGMCGNNDGCSENDLVMKNGRPTTSIIQFANSWSIGGCAASSFVNSCGTNGRLQAQARNFCNSLFSNQKFANCENLPSLFMNICTSNYCNCRLANRNDCMCDMLDAFVRTCQVKNNELISWRASSLCPIDCRIVDQEYMICAPNKRQLSCGEEEVDPTKYDCEEGCYCPNGLRLFQDRCLFADECPCIYNDNVYNPGASIAQDCNTCVCKKGKWDCTTKICTVHACCVADPHYTTFDGKKFDFMGKCMYYVVRGIGFDVICDHYVWRGAFIKDVQSMEPSYCAKVIVHIKDDIIELEQRHTVKVNGYILDWFPYITPGFRINQPSSELTTVSLRNSVTVSFNGNSWANVDIPTTMIGRVKGLFGTYTKTQDDDYLMPNGTITMDPVEFGNSWKVPGSCENEYTGPVHHPCSINPDRRPKAENACALMKSDLFEGCSDDTDYESCIYDACLCPDEQTTCVCELYALQARNCLAKGKQVDWRKQVPECQVQCPPGQIYQICGNSCSRSCEDISANPTCEPECVEGCNCPEGQTLNHKRECVQINKCTCIWGEGRYPAEYTFIDEDNKCTCTNAKWNVTTATEEDKKKYPSLDELKQKCSANDFQVYTGCKRTNTVTCQNKHLNEQADYDNCISGCQCMEGFVFDTELNNCVRPEDCPCLYNGVSYPDNTERTERHQKCICKDGFWSCSPSEEHWEKCSVWGNVHVRTFDELIYSFRGNCVYTLFEHTSTTNGLFKVTLTTKQCNVGSCITNVNIHSKSSTGNEDNVIFTAGEEFVPPRQLANLVITNLDLSIMVDVIGMGVRVIWNKGGWVHIHVSRIWTSWTHAGLCGKYDDNPGNDLQTPTNENGVKQLVDYYRVDKTCPDASELKEVNLILLERSCDILYNEVFRTCRLLKPVEGYYNRCLIDANLQLLVPENQRFNYYCQTLSAYAQECNDVNVPVNWRTNEICPYQCKTNKVYYACETPCLKETCQNAVKCPDKVCAEACNVETCPADMVYKDNAYGQCILREECESTATSTVEGYCIGDPHCVTFDGKTYDFMGKCIYYLVRGLGFDIMCDHYIWNKAFVKDVKSTAPSYCAKVIVQVKDDVIELEQGDNVKVNGQKLEWFPYIDSEFRISQPSGDLITVSLRNSVTVSWNGNSRPAVSIPTTMLGKVKGLLGTYTKSQEDDFLMPNGTITRDPNEFGHSWKVPGSCNDEYIGPVHHPCSINPNRKERAEQQCALLKSDLFAGCRDDTDYENCIYDGCQCPDEQTTCICEFYTLQANKCVAKGIEVDWHKNVTECQVQCPTGQIYQGCGNSCTRSCEDISSNPTCEPKCVEGCNCPEGQTLNDKKQCIPINKCTCSWEGEHYASDFIFIDENNKYTCINGKWNITIATEEDKTKYPSLTELQQKCSAKDFLVYAGCKRTNTVTCQNKHFNDQADYDNCVSGCQCMKDFVLDTETGSCVKPEDCPCLYNGISYPNNAVRNEKNQKCVCRNRLWTCTPSQEHWEKCSVWGNVHVRTFDELIYSFKGNCEYTLFEHTFATNGLFRVTLTTKQCNVGSCITNVHIHHKDANGKEDNIIFTTGQEFIPPTQLANLVVTNLDLSIMVDVVGMGVRVIWNKGGWVHIHVSRIWTSWNHVGLCGKYDDNPGNDLQTPTNESGVKQLVDYYRVDKTCPDSTELPEVNLILLEKSCDILYSNVFKTCRLLKPVEAYYNRCLIDANLQLLIPENQRFNYYCQTLSAYAQECNDVNIPVAWRTNKICPYQCKTNLVYYPCETPCPKETCQNAIECTDKVCAEACNVATCPANMVYNDNTYGQCILRKECESINIPTVEGYCVGDPHCVTFDGKRYDFMGKCIYYLVRGVGFDIMCDHYVWNGGAFVKDVKSTAPSYCAKVIVEVKDNIIELEQGINVKVNGQKLDWFPYITPEFRISQTSSVLITVTLKNSVTLSWNGNSKPAVRIPLTMLGTVKGLLGTFTKTQDDDFLMPNGTITRDPNEFGHSWKVPGSCDNEYTGPVHHPCSINPNRKDRAERECAILKSDLFAGCLEDVDAVYENCIYDGCQCSEEQTACFCEFYAIQAEKCAAKGIYVNWRDKISGCSIQCPPGQKYQVCGNSCTRSCEDIAANPKCTRQCVDGCNCPEGQTLNSRNQCVSIATCPCIWEGGHYNPGFILINETYKWLCSDAKWNITTATTDDKDKYPDSGQLNNKCNANDFLVYADCIRRNAVTCQNKHLHEQPDYENCQNGCQCMDGFVLDTDKDRCVRPYNCPCIYKGVSYPNKAERNEKGQKCICKEEVWSCTPSTDYWEKCSVWNNVHVRTFDEVIYSFRGNCEYILFEHVFATNGLFRVTLKTAQCNVGSCITNVYIYHRDGNGNVDNIIFTTGQEFVADGQLVNLVVTNLELSVMVDVVGMGVRVVWNKAGWVHIHVSRIWTSWNHNGLCGQYDDNPGNDLETPTKEYGVTQLVDYYRVDKTCPESTELKKVIIILPEKHCDILYSEIFKTCRCLKSVEEYYNRCLIDANLQLLIPENQRFNYYCPTFSAYAQECNDVNEPVHWRTNEICPYQCKGNKEYYPCETPCPKETCKNAVECTDKVCSEACNVKNCPANNVYKDSTYNECVPREQCGGNEGIKPCPSTCSCHPTHDEQSNTVDIQVGCNTGNKCSLTQLIFNIYTMSKNMT